MKISGYTTARNVIEMDYPFEEAINSVLAFADEVVVLDSTEPETSDGTTEKLRDMAKADPRIKHVVHKFDRTMPNHGIYDGQAKALARQHCKGDFLFQIDSDEVVHELHAPMVRPFIEKYDWNSTSLVGLPVIDLWGRGSKARTDVTLWKWRISRNLPEITHGIPINLRKYEGGLLYSHHGSDGCDYINKYTGQPIPCATHVTAQVEQLRQVAVTDQRAIPTLETWLNKTYIQLPTVFHYSWFNIERKVRNYQQFWNLFWKSLYNEDRDERTNPMFPGKMWSEVTDEMYAAYATNLEEKTGGHVFHRPWDGRRTNSINVSLKHPAIMKNWIERQGKK